MRALQHGRLAACLSFRANTLRQDRTGEGVRLLLSLVTVAEADAPATALPERLATDSQSSAAEAPPREKPRPGSYKKILASFQSANGRNGRVRTQNLRDRPLRHSPGQGSYKLEKSI